MAKLVDLLIKRGAKCKKKKNGEDGTTPLCIASYAGHVDIVDSLVAQTANKMAKMAQLLFAKLQVLVM